MRSARPTTPGYPDPAPPSKSPRGPRHVGSPRVAHVEGTQRFTVGALVGGVEASAAMGASAYATGNHVAFKGAPDLHTTAHEAAHVVQQRAGVSLKGGGAVALEASLLVKTAEDPAAVAKDLLSRLVARGVSAGEVRGAAAWVSYLLAGKAPVRAAVVEALLAFTGELAAVRDAVDGELDDAELAAVRAAS